MKTFFIILSIVVLGVILYKLPKNEHKDKDEI